MAILLVDSVGISLELDTGYEDLMGMIAPIHSKICKGRKVGDRLAIRTKVCDFIGTDSLYTFVHER